MEQSKKKLRHKETFADALYDSGGRTFMLELLNSDIPPDIQKSILDKFNSHIDRVNEAMEKGEIKSKR